MFRIAHFIKEMFWIRFRSEEEQTYCERRMNQRENDLHEMIIKWSIPIHLGLSSIFYWVVPSVFFSLYVLIHLPLGMFQLFVAVTKGEKIAYATATVISMIWIIAGHSIAMFQIFEDPSLASWIPVTLSLHIAIHQLNAYISPTNKTFGGLIPLAMSSVIVVAVMNFEHRLQYLILFYVAFFFGLMIIRYNHHLAVKTYKKEYQRRVQMLPASFVHDSIMFENIVDVFPPIERECVYICSDWRQYQALTSDTTPGHLALILNGYYNMCQKLLQKHFPKKNYVMDWIADELIVILFRSSREDTTTLINQGLDFSIDLMKQKTKYFKEFEINQAIDIGMVHGEAFVGLMGPSGNLKATALGERPGKSRRLQSFGKNLREIYGDMDRVIMDTDTFFKISRPVQIKEHIVDVPIKDVKDQKVFFLEVCDTKRTDERHVS